MEEPGHNPNEERPSVSIASFVFHGTYIVKLGRCELLHEKLFND